MTRATRALLTSIAALVLALSVTSTAHAESGRYNLHFSGLGPFPAGGEASFDWQLAQPFALEARVGGGVIPPPFVTDVEGIFYFTIGARFRFFEDESGYLDEGGSAAGHFWFGPQAGFFIAGAGPAAGFLLDVSVGYDFSIVNPVSIGPFLRGGFGVNEVTIVPFVAGGVEVSIEFEPIRHPVGDADGDGLNDNEDRCPDTPPGETVDEMGCHDSDHDGVFDHSDECPGTPEGSEVDVRGCIVLPPELVLDGIAFAYDSAEILPESEGPLENAAQALRDNPEVRIEIGGHTDDIGSEQYNRELSLARAEAVRDWLVAHDLDAGRFEVQGYGPSQPRVPNTDDAARAQNRRIEFRQLPSE